LARGGVRLLSLARAHPSLQPGLDGGARTLEDVARAVAARLRAAAAAGPWGGAVPAYACVAELTNDALLLGRSQRVLVSAALPTAVVAE
jgi:hypothetical protein